VGDIKDKTWDEKYKPNTRDEILGQPHIKARLDNWTARGRIPHLLFAGPPGVGKTSTAIALAKDLYGSIWRENFHVYNASSSRGIDFIRHDIQALVTTVPTGGAVYHIIFLDEADELTKEAQTALREIMMRHPDTAKFIFSCNYPHKIIAPIKDRCAMLRFGYLLPDTILYRMRQVCEKESVTYDEPALIYISEHSNGSLRKALQGIEECVDVNNHLSFELVNAGKMLKDAEDTKELLKKAFANDIEGYETQLFTLHYKGGFCASELLESILKEFNAMKMAIEIKQALIIQLAEYDWRISQGANELLQMRCFLGTLHNIINIKQ
jgi:replication factor C small subunit